VGDRVTPFFDPVRYESRGRKDFILMVGADFGSYEVPHQLVEQLYRDTGVRTAPLRGISWTANKFAVETFIDEIAVKRGTDPVAYRLELIKDPRARRVIETVANLADWGKKRDGRGMGFAFLN
jgi:isoquinoline 1-oxidoreductase subunit beta